VRISREDASVRDGYQELLGKLKQQLLGPLGKLAEQTRRDIIAGRIVDARLNDLVVRVRANASSVTQAHIDALKAAGTDEDEIFDAVVCAAFLAGEERYEATLAVLAKAGDRDAT
jgi:alkylhydroperoxidase/carboxymuconolactone decarboxylase family protein YurZ